jgi:DNA-binding MarR family transcriptional regulator
MKATAQGARRLPVEDFRRHLRVLEREIVRQLEGETTCCGVTLPQCHVLLELSLGDLSLTALAAALDLDKSTLSRTVEGLVQTRLVERTVDPADRHAVCLRLAPAGRERVRTIDGMCNGYYEALLGRLSASDRRQVFAAVRLLAQAMRDLRARPSAETACCAPPRPRANAPSRGRAATPPVRPRRGRGKAA